MSVCDIFCASTECVLGTGQLAWLAPPVSLPAARLHGMCTLVSRTAGQRGGQHESTSVRVRGEVVRAGHATVMAEPAPRRQWGGFSLW